MLLHQHLLIHRFRYSSLHIYTVIPFNCSPLSYHSFKRCLVLECKVPAFVFVACPRHREHQKTVGQLAGRDSTIGSFFSINFHHDSKPHFTFFVEFKCTAPHQWDAGAASFAKVRVHCDWAAFFFALSFLMKHFFTRGVPDTRFRHLVNVRHCFLHPLTLQTTLTAGLGLKQVSIQKL